MIFKNKDPVWMVMCLGSLALAISSPYPLLNIIALYVAYSYYKLSGET